MKTEVNISPNQAQRGSLGTREEFCWSATGLGLFSYLNAQKEPKKVYQPVSHGFLSFLLKQISDLEPEKLCSNKNFTEPIANGIRMKLFRMHLMVINIFCCAKYCPEVSHLETGTNILWVNSEVYILKSDRLFYRYNFPIVKICRDIMLP